MTECKLSQRPYNPSQPRHAACEQVSLGIDHARPGVRVEELELRALGALAAAALALVNQARESRGEGRVGLVAPALYAAAGAGDSIARDITEGDNHLFGIDCCDATLGLDQASGWGAPDFAAMATLAD